MVVPNDWSDKHKEIHSTMLEAVNVDPIVWFSKYGHTEGKWIMDFQKGKLHTFKNREDKIEWMLKNIPRTYKRENGKLYANRQEGWVQVDE